MAKADLFTKEEERHLLNLISVMDWTQATNLVHSKTIPMIIKVYRNSGRVFEGGFFEENEFINENWIKIYEYLKSDDTYLKADSPFGYIVKHIQKYILRLDGNVTKSPHLFQDSRYAGSQRIPYKRRIRGKDFREIKAVSYDKIIEGDSQLEDGDMLRGSMSRDKSLCEENLEDAFSCLVSEKEYKESFLTKDKTINMIYQNIADVKENIDVNELSMGKDSAMFLTNKEKEAIEEEKARADKDQTRFSPDTERG